MDISLSFNSVEQAATSFHQQCGGHYQLANRETALTLPASIGQGYLRMLNLRNGLDLFIYEYELTDNLILDFQQLSLDQSFFNFTFCLSGRCSGRLPGLKAPLNISAWQTAFSTVPYAAGVEELWATQKISVIELVIMPPLMLGLIESSLNALPTNWQQILRSAATTPSYQLSNTSPALSCVLQQMLKCPYQGSLRQIYLEGKALELIALYFAELTATKPDDAAIKPKERDCLHQAKYILLENMSEPPSLATLARGCDLNLMSM